ncbi:MAG: hypothetical protein CFE43_02520 [Burkholderiales bacterium PBB3]|nr:MAG: hypothetical protein CFE43_02520 [Burkholderiales bacterium PBB3]
MSEAEANPFYDTPLGRCILAGDISGVMDTVDGMAAAERAAALFGVHALVIDRWKLVRKPRASDPTAAVDYDYAHANRLFRAVEMARFMCTPDAKPEDYWMHIGVQDIAAYQQRYRPALSAQNLDKQLRGEHGWHYRHHIHRAVAAGLLPRPDTEEYRESLFFGDLRQESNVVLKHVEADPGLAPFLLALFDREGPSDASFAAVEKYCHDPALYWSTAFISLCQLGFYSRTQLLDKTLGTLACDWPQFKSGWFSRFHDMLAPTVDEMAAFAPRYLALCHSRIAPTVSLAMDAVARLYAAGCVEDAALCDAMQAVVSSAVKGRVLSALELLGQLVKRDPAQATHVSCIAAHALAHSGADVQKKAITCLKIWGLDAAGQAVAQGYLPFVAAVNQAALAALLGADTPVATASPPVPKPATANPGGVNLSPLDSTRALLPIAGINDLIECIAYVFENPADVDAWERAAEALVRMAPIPPHDHAAFSALKKRAKRLAWDEKPLGFALAQLMVCALGGSVDATAMTPKSGGPPSSKDFIAWRTQSLLAQARQGLGLPPLSAATHRGGFIDPAQLRLRQAAFQRAGFAPAAYEQAFAQMRVLPAGGEQHAFAAKLSWSVSSSDGEYVFHSLHIGVEPPVVVDDQVGLTDLLKVKHLSNVTAGRWQTESDAACIGFAASLLPSDLEPFFAEAAHALGNNLDWWEATWQNRAYLDVLLQPTTPITPMAHLTLAVALAGKEPGQTALAVDVLVRSVQDGRLSMTAMGETLASLWATPLVKGSRYGKSLAAAAQADAVMSAVVYALLCAMVAVRPEAPRRDLAPLLELMLELQLTHGLAMPPVTRAALTAMRLTGKSKAAAQGLLA